jgi:hypothetical protein
MQDCSGVLDCLSQSEEEADSCDRGVLVIGSAEIELSNGPLSHNISDTADDTADNDTIDAALAEHRPGPSNHINADANISTNRRQQRGSLLFFLTLIGMGMATFGLWRPRRRESGGVFCQRDLYSDELRSN